MMEICHQCDGSGAGVADTTCTRCNGLGAEPMTPEPQTAADNALVEKHTMRKLWRPIAELADLYQQPLWIASPKLIHGDSNPQGIAEAYWQDADWQDLGGHVQGEWRTTSFDMCNDEWNTISLARDDVTHFLIPEGPWLDVEAKQLEWAVEHEHDR